MKFTETPLPGAYIIDLEKKGDERGFFARYFCKKEYGVHNLCSDIVQINNSLSAQAGTLRGMHYQLPPKAEDKIVRCVKGGIGHNLPQEAPHAFAKAVRRRQCAGLRRIAMRRIIVLIVLLASRPIACR